MEEKENLTEQTQDEIIEQESVEQQSVKNEISEDSVKEIKPKKKTRAERKKEREEKELAEYENLSDDEIYTKIQTNKLLKRKKKKRIATIAAMAVSFVLAVCVIVLATVPVSLKPKCMESGYASAGLLVGKRSGKTYYEGQDGYSDFKKVYDKAFGQSYISAIFSGSLYDYKIEEKMQKADDIVGDNGTFSQNNTYYVRLNYSEEQTVTYQNGTPYKSVYRNSKYDGKLTFTNVYFEVSSEEGFRDTKVYIVVKYPKLSDNDEKDSYIVTITVKANTSVIYNAWDDLTK